MMSVLPAVKIEEDVIPMVGKASGTAKPKARVFEIVRGKGFKRKKTEHLSELQRHDLVVEFRMKARKLGRSILRKWHARMDLQEVDSIVDLSLCEAVKRYDPNKGASFMTFLYYHLKGNLIRAVSAAASANTIPVHDSENGSAQRNDQRRDYSNFVNAIDVAEALCNHERLLPDEVFLKKEMVKLSLDACDRLDPLESEVIRRIYIQGQQLMDIANSLGYSRCHISRVKKKALEALNQDMTFSLQFERGSNSKDRHLQALNHRQQAAPERKKIHRRRPRSKKALEAQIQLKRVVNE